MTQATTQQAATVAGLVLLAIGVLGLVPSVTTNYAGLAFAGDGSRAELLGVFRVSVLLDAIHLLAGAAALVLARTERGARAFLVVGGIAFLVLGLLGLVGIGGSIPLGTAVGWLHVGLGAGLLAAAYFTMQAAARRTS